MELNNNVSDIDVLGTDESSNYPTSGQSQSQSSSSGAGGACAEEEEDPSTQVMDEDDGGAIQVLGHDQDDPNAWAKLESVSGVFRNIILTKDVSSFGKQDVDHDITAEFYKAGKDASIMAMQVSINVLTVSSPLQYNT